MDILPELSFKLDHSALHEEDCNCESLMIVHECCAERHIGVKAYFTDDCASVDIERHYSDPDFFQKIAEDIKRHKQWFDALISQGCTRDEILSRYNNGTAE
jgi:hypothetical protein